MNEKLKFSQPKLSRRDFLRLSAITGAATALAACAPSATAPATKPATAPAKTSAIPATPQSAYACKDFQTNEELILGIPRCFKEALDVPDQLNDMLKIFKEDQNLSIFSRNYIQDMLKTAIEYNKAGQLKFYNYKEEGTPTIYYQKNLSNSKREYTIVTNDSRTTLHELGHFFESLKNDTEWMPERVEEGLCDFISAVGIRRLTQSNKDKYDPAWELFKKSEVSGILQMDQLVTDIDTQMQKFNAHKEFTAIFFAISNRNLKKVNMIISKQLLTAYTQDKQNDNRLKITSLTEEISILEAAVKIRTEDISAMYIKLDNNELALYNRILNPMNKIVTSWFKNGPNTLADFNPKLNNAGQEELVLILESLNNRYTIPAEVADFVKANNYTVVV